MKEDNLIKSESLKIQNYYNKFNNGKFNKKIKETIKF